VLVAAAFGAFQIATVVTDARLQASITGPSRAAITSLASLGTDVVTIAVYVGYAVLAPAGHRVAFLLFAVPYLVLAGWLGRLPRRGATQGVDVGGVEPVDQPGHEGVVDAAQRTVTGCRRRAPTPARHRGSVRRPRYPVPRRRRR
jgi:hypothetical protein